MVCSGMTLELSRHGTNDVTLRDSVRRFLALYMLASFAAVFRLVAPHRGGTSLKTAAKEAIVNRA